MILIRTFFSYNYTLFCIINYNVVIINKDRHKYLKEINISKQKLYFSRWKYIKSFSFPLSFPTSFSFSRNSNAFRMFHIYDKLIKCYRKDSLLINNYNLNIIYALKTVRSIFFKKHFQEIVIIIIVMFLRRRW